MVKFGWKELITYLHSSHPGYILFQDYFPESFRNYKCLLPYLWQLTLWYWIAYSGLSPYQEVAANSIFIHTGKT